MRLQPWQLMGAALRDLTRPPYSRLLALSLFVSIVSNTGIGTSADTLTLLLTLALLATSALLQIAITLAAAEESPTHTADHWIRAAVAKKVFWRLVGTGFLVIISIAVGFVALVIPGLVACGMFALAQSLTVLDRHIPSEALRLSVELSRGHRVQLALIFILLFLLPNASLQGAFFLSGQLTPDWRWAALDLVTVILSSAATVALTKALLQLRAARGNELVVDDTPV